MSPAFHLPPVWFRSGGGLLYAHESHRMGPRTHKPPLPGTEYQEGGFVVLRGHKLGYSERMSGHRRAVMVSV